MSDRKKDHLDLAFDSRLGGETKDNRFYYEPLLSAHPVGESEKISFLGKYVQYPIWISSMTGGTREAYNINRNLAKACNEFGLSMGLGSCRPLLESKERLKDFDFRNIIGSDLPFYANLGIAQIESMIKVRETGKIIDLIDLLHADGLIIHINPMQEWLQPEGDRIKVPPIDTIEFLMDQLDINIIVKEVGQGMGPGSIKRLLSLPLEALEFGAYGGTNFAKLELLRTGSEKAAESFLEPFVYIGHTADEMLSFVNETIDSGKKIRCKSLIISGGIQNYLHGYYLMKRSKLPAIYGQASAFLKHARGDYEALQNFIKQQIEGLRLASSYLKPRK